MRRAFWIAAALAAIVVPLMHPNSYVLDVFAKAYITAIAVYGLNVILGYYEYFSGHRLIPLTLGDVTVMAFPKGVVVVGTPSATFSKLPNQNSRSLMNGPPTVNPYSCLKNAARPQPSILVSAPPEKSLNGQPCVSVGVAAENP